MQTVRLERAETLAKTFLPVLIFTFLMIVASFIRIPLFFSPVPVTLQTLVLFLSLAFLKEKAFIPQLIYLMLGAAGLPVFANAGAGLGYILGPTGGYLLGFLISAVIFGGFLRRFVSTGRARILTVWVIFALANIFIYAGGTAWLIVAYGFSFKSAFAAGVMPFIIPDAAKITLASFIAFKLALR